MNRLHLLLSRLAFSAILLLLVGSSAVFGQVSYTITGTLSLVSGSDPLGLNGKTVHATATISQTMTPSSFTQTATSSTNTYTGVTVALAGFNCSASSSPPVTVTLTDTFGGAGTLAIANCNVAGLAVVNAMATVPSGNLITAVPASIPTTVSLTSGTISFTLTGSTTPGSFNLENGTMQATGTPPPTVTPSLTFWTAPSVAMGSTTPESQQVTFTTSPSNTYDAVSFATSSSASWLTVTPAVANTSAPITLTVNPTGLTQSFYSGTVTLSYGPAALSTEITVTLNLTASAVTLTAPSSMTFNYTPGGTPPASQQLAVGAGSPTAVKAAVTSGNSWLSVSPASGTTPVNFAVSINTTGLTTGVLNGNIQITATGGATNSPLNVPVSLTVSSSTLTVPTTALTFNYTVAGTAPPAQAVNISGTSGISFAASAATTSGGSWLAVTPTSGTVSSTSALSIAVNTTGLAIGMYSGAVTVTSSGAAGSPAVIPVTLNVVAAGPTISTVVSGASYSTTGFGPGTIVTIFGNLLGPKTGEVFSVNSAGTLNSTLGGVTVTVEGAPAVPLYVSNGQINLILPFSLSTSGQAAVQVLYNNLTSVQYNIPLAPADVQIFTVSQTGSGPGAILNQDFTVNTASNPAPAGTVIQIYGTGGGVLGGSGTLGPAVTAGGVGGSTLSWVALPYSATVNGETAKVDYAGDAPYLVFGVYQFNVTLPADTPSGSQNIVLTVGGSSSQSDVTVFVK